jgi:Mg2+ and Co2+ transporter CorA
MSKDRKAKLIEEIENELDLIEQELIDTPPEMSLDQYGERIEKIKKLRLTLELLRNL